VYPFLHFEIKPNIAKVVEYIDIECLTKENFKHLIESVNFMSDKFDGFGKQMQVLIMPIENMKEEN
jgi:hypothetical protein